MIGQTISHYKILAKLGQGGMGEVFKAEDIKLKRTVALKFLSAQALNTPEAKTRFLTEARAAAALDHPNICAVHEIDEFNGRLFIAMTCVEGENLADRIASGPLKIEDTLRWGIEIARGLQEAHAKGTIHRDIKSANILITESGQAKITDFGLARLIDSTRLTSAGTILGTAAYMSPEQLAGEAVDRRSDIWSLGVVLYEMLTGRLPFLGEHDQAIAYQIMHEDPEPITAIRTGVPMELERIVTKCMAKKVSDRYQHIDDLAVDLRNVKAGSPARIPSRGKSPFVPALLALLAVAVIVVVVVWRPFSDTLENPLANAKFSAIVDFEASEAVISPDGRMVAFVSDKDGPFDVWVSQVGTGNIHNRTKGEVGDVRRDLQALNFSADGSKILILGDGHERLRSMPLLDGPLRNELRDSIVHADWAADGSRVVYYVASAGDPVFVADGDGTHSQEILGSKPGMHQHYPTWSPDGKWIYVSRGLENIWDTDLWRVHPDGRNLERLTTRQRDVSHPTPLDDRTVLFVGRNEEGSGPWLWVLDVETKACRRASIGLESYQSLSGSHDGKRLAATVTHPQAQLWSVPILEGRATQQDVRRYEVPAVRALAPRFNGRAVYFLSSHGTGDGLWKYEDGKLLEIWNGAHSSLFDPPSVSPDGQFVAIVMKREGKRRLHVLATDGSGLRSLADGVDARGSASWSPDGQWITVGGQDAGGQGLFKVAAATGEAQRITEESALYPVWSPRGDLIVFAAKQVAAVSALHAVRPDGTPVNLPRIEVRIRGARFRFLPDGSGLVYMRGWSVEQSFWLLDLTTMVSSQLTEHKMTTATRTFDITPDGQTIVFDREQNNPEIVLIELADN